MELSSLILSIVGIVLGAPALLLGIMAKIDSKRESDDRKANDEITRRSVIFIAKAQGARVDAAMMQRWVPGFDEDSPLVVDVVNLLRRLNEAQRDGHRVTVSEIRDLGSGVSAVYESPQVAVDEAISKGLAKKSVEH